MTRIAIPGFLAALLFALIPVGCGNSGGSSNVSGRLGTGTTFLTVKDNPPVEIDGFTVTIEKATLLGPDGPYVIFDGERTVDLLDHQDQEFLLALDEVPVGTYDKIRLQIRDAEVSPNPMGLPVFVPGNGKLDLNPQGDFEIVGGEVTTIRIDFDVARAIHVVLTGNQRFIVRPVAFVDIETGARDPIAVTDLAGTVIATDTGLGTIEVDLDQSGGVITVVPGDAVTVFDEELLLIGFEMIEVGDRVLLRGRIDSDGMLDATAILLGDPLRTRGELPDGTFDPTWSFDPDPGSPLVGLVDSTLADGALAWIEDGAPIDPDSLPLEARARVTGRYFATESLLRAALLDLETTLLEGTITAVDLVTDPPRFTVADGSGTLTEIAFDTDTAFPLAAGGEVPSDYLRPGWEVAVRLAGTLDGLPRAWKVRVEPFLYEGNVVSVDPIGRTIVLAPVGGGAQQTLEIRPEARILRIDGPNEAEIDLSEVLPNDDIEAYGLLDPMDAPQIWLIIVLDD